MPDWRSTQMMELVCAGTIAARNDLRVRAALDDLLLHTVSDSGSGHALVSPVGLASVRDTASASTSAGLVAQQTGNSFHRISLLLPPDRRLARVDTSHDLRRTPALRCQQHDLGSLDVLLRAVPIRRDGCKFPTISPAHFNGEPCTHPADSHPLAPQEIQSRTQLSDFIH